MKRAGVVFVALGASCSSSLPEPPHGPHPPDAAILEVVDFPPPAAQSEVVPPPPGDDHCVWLDGRWEWQGRRWRWVKGEWAIPPDNCYFAPSVFSWQKPTELWMLKAHWYPDNAEELPPEKARSACIDPKPCGAEAHSYISPG